LRPQTTSRAQPSAVDQRRRRLGLFLAA
jgi:hypothetical protein